MGLGSILGGVGRGLKRAGGGIKKGVSKVRNRNRNAGPPPAEPAPTDAAGSEATDAATGALKKAGPEGWAAAKVLEYQENKQAKSEAREGNRQDKKNVRQQRRDERLESRAKSEFGIKFLLILFSFGSLILQNYLPDLFKLLLLIVVCFLILYLTNKAVIVWPWGILLVVALIILFWFSHFYGDMVYNEFEKTGVLPEAEQQLEDVGIEHQFDVIGQILTGEFEPEQLWTSEAVQSEYAVPEEFEFFLTDLSTRKEAFKPYEDLYIIGNVNLVSGFDKTTTVKLGVEPTDFCTDEAGKWWREYKEDHSEVGGILDYLDGEEDKSKLKECSDGSDWECFITGSQEVNTFQMERIYNRMFYCNHTGIYVAKDEVISSLEVKWEYSTSSVAGMQVYAFNPKTLERNPGDPLDRFSISKDSLTSWYIGDERVNLGLGLSNTPNNYVRAETGDDLFDDINYLAIGVQNKGGGTITGIESLSVSFPNTADIQVATHISKIDDDDVIFIGPTTEVITILGSDVVTKKFTLSAEELSNFESVDPSENVNYYIPFVVGKEYVGNTDFRSFLVKADIRYTYKDGDPIPVAIDAADM
jgi:hypothetical protein